MNPLHRHATAASSMMSAGVGAGDDARLDAERQRHAGAVGMARRQAEQHRPAEVRRADRRRTALIAGPPSAGSSQRGSSPKTIADARDSRPDSRSCVSMRSIRYGRSATSSMNRMCPAGGSNAYGVPSDASSCVSVPPSRTPARLAGPQHLDLRMRDRAGRRGARQHARERIEVVGRPPLSRGGRRASGRETTTTPQCPVSQASSDVLSL